MASIYDLQTAAGTVHRELSFDVDGRFATFEGVSMVDRDDGVRQMVVSLSIKQHDEAEAAPEPPHSPEDTGADLEGGDLNV